MEEQEVGGWNFDEVLKKKNLSKEILMYAFFWFWYSLEDTDTQDMVSAFEELEIQ